MIPQIELEMKSWVIVPHLSFFPWVFVGGLSVVGASAMLHGGRGGVAGDMHSGCPQRFACTWTADHEMMIKYDKC